MVGTTDNNGKIYYSQIVPTEYFNTILQVQVSFSGTPAIWAAYASVNQLILDKTPASIQWISVPTANLVRVGYSLTIEVQLSIEGTLQYSNQFLTLTTEYPNGQYIYSQVQCQDDGTANFTVGPIEEGYPNVTFLVEFSGTSTIAYTSNQTFYNIIPKWQTDMNLQPIVSTIHIGQVIPINITASFVDTTSWETFYGLSANVNFIYNNGTNQQSFEEFFNSNDEIIFNFTIPQDCGDTLQIQIIFAEQQTIAGNISSVFLSIQPKWQMDANILDLPTTIHEGQTLNMILNISFADPTAIDSLFGLNAQITIQYPDYALLLNGTLDQNGEIPISFTIPVSETQFSLQIYINGTQTIVSLNTQISMPNISPQIITKLAVIGSTSIANDAGNFSFSVQLTDVNSNPISNATITFIVKNAQGQVVNQYYAITGTDGIATQVIVFNQIGNYQVEVSYASAGIYQKVDIAGFQVNVLNFWIRLLDDWPQILIGLVTAFALIFTLYRGIYIPRRNRYRAQKLAIADQFNDAENIQYVLISHLKTGLPLFSRAFTEIPIDESLVSGFISAITSFGEELAGKGQKIIETGPNKAKSDATGLEELSYKQFKIFNVDTAQIRLSILLLKAASSTIKANAHEFNQRFETKYQNELENWAGKAFPSGPIIELIEEIFHADLLYPQTILQNRLKVYKPDTKIEADDS